jgi:hypothetical protein
VNRKHVGPAPSERQLFKLWDQVEAERSQKGERAALALVNKALQAIAPAQPAKEPR